MNYSLNILFSLFSRTCQYCHSFGSISFWFMASFSHFSLVVSILPSFTQPFVGQPKRFPSSTFHVHNIWKKYSMPFFNNFCKLSFRHDISQQNLIFKCTIPWPSLANTFHLFLYLDNKGISSSI